MQPPRGRRGAAVAAVQRRRDPRALGLARPVAVARAVCRRRDERVARRPRLADPARRGAARQPRAAAERPAQTEVREQRAHARLPIDGPRAAQRRSTSAWAPPAEPWTTAPAAPAATAQSESATPEDSAERAEAAASRAPSRPFEGPRVQLAALALVRGAPRRSSSAAHRSSSGLPSYAGRPSCDGLPGSPKFQSGRGFC
eukprot:6185851-Pleurochrysis_carterae.AAC.5